MRMSAMRSMASRCDMHITVLWPRQPPYPALGGFHRPVAAPDACDCAEHVLFLTAFCPCYVPVTHESEMPVLPGFRTGPASGSRVRSADVERLEGAAILRLAGESGRLHISHHICLPRLQNADNMTANVHKTRRSVKQSGQTVVSDDLSALAPLRGLEPRTP